MSVQAGYLITLLVTIGVTFAMTPVSRWVAVRVGAIASPSDRKVHSEATPSLGGLAIFVGAVAGIVTAWAVGAFDPVFRSTSDVIGLVLAAGIIFAVGFADDILDVSAPAKLAGIVLAGSVLAMSGVAVIWMRIPFSSFFQLSADLSIVATVFWLLMVANAVNLIDGLDGLASGIIAIAGGSFFIYAYQLGGDGILFDSNPGPLIAVVAVGTAVGFLPRNMSSKRVFMGDSGALLLGLMFAASAISVGGRVDQDVSSSGSFFFAPIVVPVILLGIPFLDLVFAVLRRALRSGVSISDADREHIHHKLLDHGHSPRATVMILWGWTAALSSIVLLGTVITSTVASFGVVLAMLALGAYTIYGARSNAGSVKALVRQGVRGVGANTDS